MGYRLIYIKDKNIAILAMCRNSMSLWYLIDRDFKNKNLKAEIIGDGKIKQDR